MISYTTKEKTMKYLVINPQTFRVLISQYGSPKYFETKGGAKRSLNSFIKKLTKTKADYTAKFGPNGFDNQSGKELAEMKEGVVIDEKTFKEKEPLAIRKCFMSGKTFVEPLNTPSFASKSCATYWER